MIHTPFTITGFRLAKVTLAVTLAAGFFIPNLHAQQPFTPEGNIYIEEGARLWIEGTTTVSDYRCYATELGGEGVIENTRNPQENIRGHGAVSISVELPVRSLDCGKRGMNRDMFEALKADRHPNIRFHLLSSSFVNFAAAGPDSLKWMNIQNRGVLEIAGVRDTVHISVEGALIDNDRFRVRGSKQIDMYTHNIEPPTALLGLVRADNMLTVHFDVTVRLSRPNNETPD